MLSQRFQNLNKEYPLGTSEALFQDQKGLLWIGTQNGLYSYDGYSFEEYLYDKDNPNSLSGNDINSIYQDSKGRIWVGVSGGGLNILNLEKDSFQRICLPVGDHPCLQEINVNAIAHHNENQMWLGTENGLYLMEYKEGIKPVKHIPGDTSKDHTLRSTFVNHLLKDQKGRLWVGTRDGIHLYFPEKDSFVSPLSKEGFPEYPILDIAKDRNGKVWISTRFSEERLFYFDERSKTFKADSIFMGTELGEFKITFDLDNNLWVSARGRGAYFSKENSSEYTFYHQQGAWKHGYSNILGLATICDRYGNIWMSGEALLKWSNTGKGINHWKSNAGKILAVYISDSYYWYCNNKPHRYNFNTDQAEDFFPDSLPTHATEKSSSYNYQRVYKFIELDEQRLIFCMFRNIIIWNVKNNTYQEFPLTYGGPFKDIALTKERTHLWICSNQGSPILLDLQSGQDYRPSFTSPIKRPTRVVEDMDGNYWFGTSNNGVFKLNSQQIVTHINGNQESENALLTTLSISDMAISMNGILWLACQSGLYAVDTKTLSVVKLKSQHPYLDLAIHSIITDNDNKVWMSTMKGIVSYDPISGKVDVFSSKDGLKNQFYSSRAAFKDKNGVLYFGGDNGTDIIEPSKLNYNEIPPDLYIESLMVNNTIIENYYATQSDPLDLHYHENFITITFLNLHLTSPSANQGFYNIPEIDTVWRSIRKNNTLDLVNLQPGKYTLLGRSYNADGIRSSTKDLIHFKIHPPWWLSSWFIFGIIAFIGLFVGGLYRYRVNEIKARERIKTRFNKQIAEVESKALRAQMNPHFLFNSINAVNSLISQGKNEDASMYLKKFGKLVRLVLSNSEQSMVRLEEELESLKLYLEIEQLRFQNFQYEINIAPSLETDFIKVPPLILQPYVENAIWHGLMHKTQGVRKVIINVKEENDDLILTVEDNGIGRKQAAQLQTQGAARKKGIGMRLTRDRLAILEKIYGSKVKTEVIDLYDKEGQAKGTKIKITIAAIR